MAKMTIDILPTKARGCAPQSPETDENDENGGCPSDKTTVCQKHRFRHPDRKTDFHQILGSEFENSGTGKHAIPYPSATPSPH